MVVVDGVYKSDSGTYLLVSRINTADNYCEGWFICQDQIDNCVGKDLVNSGKFDLDTGKDIKPSGFDHIIDFSKDYNTNHIEIKYVDEEPLKDIWKL